MEDFLGSLFCFYILWLFCKYATLCNYPCLNRRFHIVVQSELLDRIFLYRPAKTNGWTPHLMGIDGIISYVTLIPSAIYLWIRDGKFLFFNPDGVIISVWFTILFWIELGLFLLDYWIGYFLVRHSKRKQQPFPLMQSETVRPVLPMRTSVTQTGRREWRCLWLQTKW